MNYDGFNRPTFEIVRVWRNPWKCMIQPNISMTIISYTLLNDDVPAIMKTSIFFREVDIYRGIAYIYVGYACPLLKGE